MDGIIIAIPEPVILGHHEPSSEIYTKPLHAPPTPGFHLANVDETNTTVLDADHPHRWQVDHILNYMQNPGVSADVQCLHLCDREDCHVVLTELNHCLATPAQHSLFMHTQWKHDASLGVNHACHICACSTIVEWVAATSTISHINTCLLTIFRAMGFTYPPSLYYTCTTPA
jgi:hypothetical protein